MVWADSNSMHKPSTVGENGATREAAPELTASPWMRCRYCGTDNYPDDARCVKCQRRLSLPGAWGAQSAPPVVDTATAPALDVSPAEMERNIQRRLETVAHNPEVQKRLVPRQQALFAHREQAKVVAFDGPGADPRTKFYRKPADPLAAERPRSGRGKTSLNQFKFEFNVPARPSQPFTREIDRSQLPVNVAPLSLRALASTLDLLVVGFLCAVFLGAVRLWLGNLPIAASNWYYFAPTPLLLAMAYKVMFAVSGQDTLGLQSARLSLISYDGSVPTCTQRLARIGMGMLSIAAAGLGLLWAVTDEESLTWHDMATQTFLTNGEQAES